jgi:hypothetical protein
VLGVRLLIVAVAFLGASCNGAPPAVTRPELDKGPAQVSRRTVDDRPPLELVQRSGDPRPAMAFALAHELGSAGSVAIAALLEARLRARGYSELRARPHGLGLTLEILPSSTAQARAFVADVHGALARPLTARENGAAALKQGFAALRARSFLGKGDELVARCSGELGVDVEAALPDPDSEAGRQQISRWLETVFAVESSAFAAVGPQAWLAKAAEALEASPAWPHRAPAADAWPESDSLTVDFVPEGSRRLSVAFRVADGAAALLAADQLGKPAAPLGLRLTALASNLRVERATATLRPRGACLRVDVTGPRAEPGLDGELVAKALLVTRDEMELALRTAAGRWLPDGVTRAPDPRDAAAVASWRALSVLEAPATARSSAAYVAHHSERESLALPAAVAALQERWSRPSAEFLPRDEAGQGEFWMLAASSCGTLGETAADAGRRALFVRALAREASAGTDVELEPWISSDGIGLLAHAPRRDPAESPAALARRVGSALGRALLAVSPSGPTIAGARASLIEDLGGEPRAGYWLAIDALSPGRPSWLEPRGTFTALSDGGRSNVELERRLLLGEPLRVAALNNAGPAQGAQALEAFDRWLKAQRPDAPRCPEATRPAPRSGEFTLEASGSSEPEGAFVAVALPGLTAASRSALLATLFLLNRPGGWLEQALSNLTARAQARVVGGSMAAGIVIQIATPPSSETAAVAQVRGLLARLARGSTTADELALAARELGRMELESSLDPRRRIVELWRGGGAAPALDLAALRAFHGRLGSGAQAVVYVHSRL